MTRIEATNHNGWQVEELTSNGWRSLHPNCPFEKREQAENFMSLLASKESGWEYRVIEALKEKQC